MKIPPHLDRRRMTSPMSLLITRYPCHQHPAAKIGNHSAVRVNNCSTSSSNNNPSTSHSNSTSTRPLMMPRLS